ncbi:beta-ketoacyl-ACP synthase 3 [Streptomyces sp. SID8379]|uniref:beta-ketoacyl-ACP synthase III n=1 Tax=unclassified Streptomyces TaxID=2593676 RepID=UPI00035E327E|nr:beta-ketoacyl-ACP synthase III [Streptomyces sp. HmicA12]MYW66802.1 beta-ketoacyl-ACP synthase 3 [Streptomyces sp. SID8379]
MTVADRPAQPPADRATAVLEGVAGWVPPRRVSNAELPAAWGVDDAWVRRRTGIATRHWAGDGVRTGDLALEAARRVLASLDGPAPDTVLVATSTPDRPMPAMAPRLASLLGLGQVAAWDVAAACSGFGYGLATAAGVLAAGHAQRVLLVAAEVYSTLVDPADRGAGVVFADGAGAVLLRRGRSGEPGALLAFDLGSDGTGHELIQVPGGGAAERARPTDHTPADRHFRMAGREVYQHAVTRMTESSLRVLERTGWTADDVDRFVAHQANARILDAVGERLRLPADRQVANIERVGNTGAASLPLALADAASRDQLAPGERVLLTSFGAGLTWASATMTWPELPVVAPVDSAALPAVAR